MWTFGGCFATTGEVWRTQIVQTRAPVKRQRLAPATRPDRRPYVPHHRRDAGEEGKSRNLSLAGSGDCTRAPARVGGRDGSVSAAAPAAAAFARRVAVAAIDRAIPARLEGHRRGLPACRTNDGSSLGRSGTVTRSRLIVFLGLSARFAAFGRRVPALLEKRLIGSGEGEILPTVAAG